MIKLMIWAPRNLWLQFLLLFIGIFFVSYILKLLGTGLVYVWECAWIWWRWQYLWVKVGETMHWHHPICCRTLLFFAPKWSLSSITVKIFDIVVVTGRNIRCKFYMWKHCLFQISELCYPGNIWPSIFMKRTGLILLIWRFM